MSGRRGAATVVALGMLLLLAVPTASAMLTATNTIYRIYMGQSTDPGFSGGSALGQWSAMTDTAFGSAAQNQKSILYDATGVESGVTTAEEEFSIRSFTSNRVYAQNANAYTGETFTITQLSTMTNTVTQVGGTLADHIIITGADSLDVWHNITVGNNGAPPATANNSWIQIQDKVCNTGTASVTLALREHWDLMVAGADLNDKAWVTSYSPLTVGPFDANPEEVTNFSNKVAFDTRDPPQTFHVYGLLTDPPGSPFPAPVVTPSRFVYTRWQSANYAWGYGVTGGSIYNDADPDSSVIYFWGGDSGTAVPPGGCLTGRTYITLDLDAVVPPPPLACAPSTLSLGTGSAGAFTATGGSGAYTWAAPTGNPSSGNGASFSTTYGTPGAKVVTLTDSAGATSTCLVTVTAPPNQPPTVAVTGNGPETCLNSLWSFSATAADPGQDGNGGTTGFVTQLLWNFGDGFTVQGTPAAVGLTSHQYTQAGAYTVTVTATDNGGLTASTSFNLQTIGDTPCCPVIGNINTYVAYEGDTVAFTATATDLDQTATTFSAVWLPPGSTFTSAGVFSWSSTAGHRGTHQFTITASDVAVPAGGCGSSTTAVIKILPPLTFASDKDKDGASDEQDNCPAAYNPTQLDEDQDGTGDACDVLPTKPVVPGKTLAPVEVVDTDKDGIADDQDNCKNDINPSQRDADLDGLGDTCDRFLDAVAPATGGKTTTPLAAKAPSFQCDTCKPSDVSVTGDFASSGMIVGSVMALLLAALGVAVAVVLIRRYQER